MSSSHLHAEVQALVQHLTFLINHKDNPSFPKDTETAKKEARKIWNSLNHDLNIDLQSLLPPN